MSRIRMFSLAALLLLPLAAIAATSAQDDVLDLVHNPELMKSVVLPKLQDAMIFYPIESQQAGERGRVKLTFVVNTDGTVTDVQLDAPSKFWRLNDAAVQSMLSRSYAPATRDGVPVAVRIWAIDNFNPDPDHPEVDTALDVATDLQLSCRYGSHHIAVDACTTLLTSGKGQAKYVLYPRAHAYEELGQYDQAVSDYDRLIGFHPDQTDLYLNRGFSHEALGQYDKAIADYDRVVTLDPKNVIALFDRGFARERLGASAATDFKAALDARPKCATAEQRGVGTNWKNGPWSGGDPFNTNATDRSSGSLNPSPSQGPGAALGPDIAKVPTYTHNNNDGTAATHVTVVVQEVCKAAWVPDLATIPDIKQGAPDEMQRLEYRCWARAVSNKWLDDALADCTRAISLNPGFVRAHGTRGLVYFRKGDYGDAMKDLDLAISRDPRLASALYTRGLAKRQTGDMAGAQADILAARAVDPEIASTYSRYNVAP